MISSNNLQHKEEFKSDKHCDLCKSQEGKFRLVGNYVVKLSEVDFNNEKKLACQGCKIKYRNFKKAQGLNQKNRSLLKKLFSIG